MPIVSYGTLEGIKFKCGNLGTQIHADRLNAANERASARVNNETGRDGLVNPWVNNGGDDWHNIVLATEYYAACELKSGIQGYEESRMKDCEQAYKLVEDVMASEAPSEAESPQWTEVSDYGTNPLNPAAKPYPWNLEGGNELESNPELD